MAPSVPSGFKPDLPFDEREHAWQKRLAILHYVSSIPADYLRGSGR